MEFSLNTVSNSSLLKFKIVVTDRLILLQLLETIEKNGEFERYVVMLTDREAKEQRELRRRKRERERL